MREIDEYDSSTPVGGCPICRRGASFTAEEHRRINHVLPMRALTRVETQCVGLECTVDICQSDYLLCPCGHALCASCKHDRPSWVHENCPTCNSFIIAVVENDRTETTGRALTDSTPASVRETSIEYPAATYHAAATAAASHSATIEMFSVAAGNTAGYVAAERAAESAAERAAERAAGGWA